ncbi:hypothetical protein ACRQ5Q_15375 [Bradyrhizobium sp. PMVTL-01]|uniref:hypothetical protein n=1 Tax=Bradyrhizobium sp. PMVTL-01 TaxID=3434999 RepID=UPI003F71C0F6
MKLKDERPYATPEAAARRLMQICRETAPVQDGRLYIEKINHPFLFRDNGTAAEYGAGLKWLKERKIIEVHESGTYLRILNDSDSIFD